MDLFTTFSSKENLKKAFAYLKDETDESTLPLDPIWRPSISAVAQLGDEFFETLQEYIRQNKYQPDRADYIYADKDNMGVRPICVFSVVDRIVFQALLNPWVLGDIIDKKLCSSCLGNRVLGKEKYLKTYKNQWSKFCDKQVIAYNKKFVWRAEFDLQTYYESIHIETLIKILKEHFQIQDERLLKILGEQLKTWAENLTLCGIPQGANASHILANAYLYPLDTFLDDLKSSGDFEYFRYADDIVLMAKSADKIHHIVSQIVVFLRQYNLKLNEKSKLERLKNTEGIEELKFYNPYGQLNETSQQKVAKISKHLPAILRKIKDGRDTKKTEISGLKYYLKAGASIGNPQTLDDLISIIPKRPSLIYLICRYIGFYISDVDKDFYKTNKEIIRTKYEKVWKIYNSNSLTEWTKFWLLKVLSAPPFAKDHAGFQSELNKIVADQNAKFLRPLAFFYKAYVREQIDPFEDLGFTSDDIKRHIRNAKTETEKAIYYYFALYLSGVEENGMIRELLYEALQAKSPEIQTMGLFLVKNLYHLFEASPAKVNTRSIVTKWNIKLERDITGEFSRIYLKLPDRKPLKERIDDLLTKEGKIAQDKLAPFFGIPAPLKVEVVGLQDGLKAIAQTRGDDDKKCKFPYKLPAGTIWENFIIKFLDDENVYIQVKQFKHNASYKEMGFVGRGNNPNPSEAWTFLKVLAQVNGELTLKDPKSKDKYKKQKELLAKSLQDYFSLDYDPFYPYRSSSEKQGNSYKIKITLIPPPADNEISDTEGEKDNLGLKEYLDEQSPQVYEDE